jgi:hypothetical protein
MAYTTINKSTDYFNTKLYTGDGEPAGNAITGVGFQPDFTWIKERSSSNNHLLFDAVRGVTKSISSNLDAVQSTDAQYLTAFGTDGFTVGPSNDINEPSSTYASWNWKAGTGQGSSNTDGSINTTYTSVNTTAGISISQYTGTGSNATIGHGLGAVPKMIMVKNLTNANAWSVYHASLGATKYLALNETDAAGTASDRWQDTTPTSSVFSIGTNANQGGSYDYIAYCFAEKQGFSKFGKYTANGNASGAFVYTGFKPGFIMIKSATTAMYWHIFDKTRVGFNPNNSRLNPNATDQETTTTGVIDILSNGFKIRTDQQQFGTNGATYIFMAFAEAPLVGTNNVPATAR